MIKNLEKATERKFWPWITGPDCPCSYIPEESISDKTKNPLSFWGTPPDSAGSYNSTPHETRFFCDGGGFYSHYGRFFLSWYSQFLVDHGDRVLTMANIALKGTSIVAKVSELFRFTCTCGLKNGNFNHNEIVYTPLFSLILSVAATLYLLVV